MNKKSIGKKIIALSLTVKLIIFVVVLAVVSMVAVTLLSKALLISTAITGNSVIMDEEVAEEELPVLGAEPEEGYVCDCGCIRKTLDSSSETGGFSTGDMQITSTSGTWHVEGSVSGESLSTQVLKLTMAIENETGVPAWFIYYMNAYEGGGSLVNDGALGGADLYGSSSANIMSDLLLYEHSDYSVPPFEIQLQGKDKFYRECPLSVLTAAGLKGDLARPKPSDFRRYLPDITYGILRGYYSECKTSSNHTSHYKEQGVDTSKAAHINEMPWEDQSKIWMLYHVDVYHPIYKDYGRLCKYTSALFSAVNTPERVQELIKDIGGDVGINVGGTRGKASMEAVAKYIEKWDKKAATVMRESYVDIAQEKYSNASCFVEFLKGLKGLNNYIEIVAKSGGKVVSGTSDDTKTVGAGAGTGTGTGTSETVVDGEDGESTEDESEAKVGWICDCQVPCPYCECHGKFTDEITGGSVSLTETSGEFQGLWTNTSGATLVSSDMWAYVESLPAESKNLINSTYKNYIGTGMTGNVATYKNSKWNTMFSDGVGWIFYNQGYSGGEYVKSTHKLNPFDNSAGVSFSAGFCGGYATSMVMSSMLHRYIHPTEIAIAMATYGERHGTGESLQNQSVGTNALLTSAVATLFNESKYEGKSLFEAKLVNGSLTSYIADINVALKDGGCVIFVCENTWTSAGHYVAIMEKTNNGTYLISSSTDTDISHHGNINAAPGKEVTLTQLALTQKSNNRGMIIVSKGAGYADYMAKYATAKTTTTELNNDVAVDSKGITGIDVVNYAKTFVGVTPYVFGGASLITGIDCSGFTQAVYLHFGYMLNRTSKSQVDSKGVKKIYTGTGDISTKDLKVGDIIGYDGHVAMYAGNGSIVHASNPKDGVKISPSWSYRKVVYVVRVIN